MRTTLLGIFLSVVSWQVCADLALSKWSDPNTGMSFIKVEKGCFEMGTEDAVGPYPDPFWRLVGYEHHLSDDEIPKHKVCLDTFWMGRYEVTQKEWQRIMHGIDVVDPSAMNQISWQQAQQFVARMNEQGKSKYRLPTEAEWEYACLGGSTEEVAHFSTELSDDAWYSRGDSRRHNPQPVGQLSANGYGLHDMLGNVWEWTEDSYDTEGYSRHELFDPVITDTGKSKVIRGGSFRTEPRQTRCNGRGRMAPGQAMDSIGMRLVRLAGDEK